MTKIKKIFTRNEQWYSIFATEKQKSFDRKQIFKVISNECIEFE